MKISRDEFFKRIETIYNTFPNFTILEQYEGVFKLYSTDWSILFGLPLLYLQDNLVYVETNKIEVSIGVEMNNRHFFEDEFEEFGKLANQAVDTANKISDILHA